SAFSVQDVTGGQSNLASSVFSSPSPTVVPESDEESGELSISDPSCPSLRLCFESQDAEPVPFENGGPPTLDQEREAVEPEATEVEAKGLQGMEEVTTENQGTTTSIPNFVQNFQLDSDTDVEDEVEAGDMSKTSESADLMDADEALEVGGDTDVDEPVLMDPGAAYQKNRSAVVDVSSDTDVEEEVEAIGVPKAQQTAENGDSDTDAEDGMENSSVVCLGSDPQMEDGCKGMGKAEENPHLAHPKGSEVGENEDSDTDVEEAISHPEVKVKFQQSSENEDSDTDVDDTSLKVENPGETSKTHETALDGDGDTDVEMADLVLENSDVAQPHSPHPISSKDCDEDLGEIPLKGIMHRDGSHLEEGNAVAVAAVEEVKNLNVQQQSSDEAASEQSRNLDEKENPEIMEKRAISPQNQCLPVLSVDNDTDVEEEAAIKIQDVACEENHKPIVPGPSGGGQRSCLENHDIGLQNSPGRIEVEDSDTDVEVISPPHKESVAQDSDTDVEEVTLPRKLLEEQDTQLLVPVTSRLDGEKSSCSAMEVRVHHGPCKEDEDTDAEGNKSCSGEDSNTDDDPDLAFQTTQCFLSSGPSSPRTEMSRDTAAADSRGNLEEEPTQDFRSPSVPTRLPHGKECKSPLKEEDSDPDAYTLEATQLFCSESGQLSEEPTQAFVVEEKQETALFFQHPPEEGECSEQTTQAVVAVLATRGQQATSLPRDSIHPSSIGLPFSEPVSQTAVDEGAEGRKKEEGTQSVQPVQSPPMGSNQPLTLQEVKGDSITVERVCTAIPEGGSIAGLSQTPSEADGELEERSSVPMQKARDVEQVPEHSKEEPSLPETSAPGQQCSPHSVSATSPAPVPQGRSLRRRGHVESRNAERSEEPAAPVSRRRGLRRLSSPTLHVGELEGKTEQSKEEEVSPHKKPKNGELAVTTRQGRARCLQREAEGTGKLKEEMQVAAGSPGTRELTRRGKQRIATQSVEEHQPELPQTRSKRRSNPSVLFTGVIDEEGEQVVMELGGSLAESVFDCTHLVTDRVRRTSRQNSFFLAPNSFLVRDPEQEKNFQFSLSTSLRTAQQEGGLFQEKRIVVSCPYDLPRCKPAQDAKVPIANSEFILTGILQQKINLEAHRLDEVDTSFPTSPAAPTTRASKRRAVAQTAPAPPSTAKRRR
ncbi:hypothetical protein JD844_013442, partial [Phrynosoma platyrhinos]